MIKTKMYTLHFAMKTRAPFLKLSSAERKGILSLCLFIVILFGIRISLPYLLPGKSSAPRFNVYIADNEENDHLENPSADDHVQNDAKKLFHFDPNTATRETLIQLGFKPFLAERLIKYREKVGAFKSKDDVKKVYGMRQDFYEIIAPYLLLPDHLAENSFNSKKTVHKTQQKKEINLLDSAGLDSLKGVSAYFASRIKNYREKLGGFYSLDQLDEIYKPHAGDTTNWLSVIKAQLTCDALYIQRIKINTEAREIFRHPYIGYKKAKALMQYKKEHGEFLSIENLGTTKLFTEAELEKLRFYMDFER